MEKYNSIMSTYYKDAEIAILVYEIDVKESLERVRKWA